MKQRINIIDLDKTLIPYDSFEFIIKKEIFKFNLLIFFYTFLRVVRLISLKELKNKVTLVLEKKYKNIFFRNFAQYLYKDIDLRVLREVEKETDDNTINILLSASPNIYVKYLIEKLEWIGSGSYFDDEGNFIHLHGNGKINWVNEKYNFKEFNYNLAISDSSSDDKLLSLFKRKIKWILHLENIKN